MTRRPAPRAEGAPPARPCPICGRMSVAAFHPFCSKRCADIDLHRWLGGTYAIPGEPVSDEEEPDKG